MSPQTPRRGEERRAMSLPVLTSRCTRPFQVGLAVPSQAGPRGQTARRPARRPRCSPGCALSS